VKQAPLAFVLALTALVASGCGWVQLHQRSPGSIGFEAEEGERPSSSVPGADETPVVVQRDSDPVWVRRPGASTGYLLPFYQKRERIAPGFEVRTGAGGRAEVLWSSDATALILFDKGVLTIGDPGLDQPTLSFQSVTRAFLTLTPEDRVALPGGALLRGDPAHPTGLLLLEEARPELLRLTNQSKLAVRVSYRDLELDLSAGDSIDLPVLAFGSAPFAASAEAKELPSEALSARLLADGGATESELADGLAVRAERESEVDALGVQVRLQPGAEARFLRPAQPRE
jgi:hypothetical protein